MDVSGEGEERRTTSRGLVGGSVVPLLRWTERSSRECPQSQRPHNAVSLFYVVVTEYHKLGNLPWTGIYLAMVLNIGMYKIQGLHLGGPSCHAITWQKASHGQEIGFAASGSFRISVNPSRRVEPS